MVVNCLNFGPAQDQGGETTQQYGQAIEQLDPQRCSRVAKVPAGTSSRKHCVHCSCVAADASKDSCHATGSRAAHNADMFSLQAERDGAAKHSNRGHEVEVGGVLLVARGDIPQEFGLGGHHLDMVRGGVLHCQR